MSVNSSAQSLASVGALPQGSNAAMRSLMLQLGVMAGAQILGVLTAPGPKRPSFEDIQINRADASNVWPYICGTVRVTPHLLWYGDFNTKKVKNDVGVAEMAVGAGVGGLSGYVAGGGTFGLSPTPPSAYYGLAVGSVTGAVVAGLGQLRTWSYRQYLGFAYGICHGQIDAVNAVLCDEKRVNESGVTLTGNTGQMLCDFPTAFGGDHEAGGVYWLCDIVRGDFWPTQQPLPYLVDQIGDTVPAFSGKALFVVRGPSGYRESGYFAATGTVSGAPVRPLKLEVSRYPNNLGVSEFKNVNDGDANPAECIYEWLISPAFGVRRLSTSKIDVESFQDVAEQLFDEGVGCSLEFNSETDCETAIETFCALSDCILVGSFRTGQLGLKHISRTYSIAETFTRGYDSANSDRSLYNVIAVEGFTPGTWDATINDLHYSFVDRLNNFQLTRRSAPDLANHLQQGRHRVQSQDLQGIATGDQAAYTASRELRAASYPRPPITLTVNRDGDLVNPYDVIRLVDHTNDITKDLLVLDKQPGNEDESRIKFVCVEHVYGVGNATFSPTPDPDFVDPVGTPAAISSTTQSKVQEAPYFLSGNDDAQLLVMAAKPNNSQVAFDAYVSTDGGTSFEKEGDALGFTPTATLDAAIARLTADTVTTVVVTPENALMATMIESASVSEIQTQSRNIIQINSEFLAFESASYDEDTNKLTLTNVWRAVHPFDSVPAPHAAGDRVWFLSYAYQVLPDEYTGTPQVKLLSRTLNDVYALASATAISQAIANRSLKSNPVRGVTVAGGYTTASIGSSDNVVMAWGESNRLLEGTILKQTDSGTTPEDTSTYTVRWYATESVRKLLRTESGIAASTGSQTATMTTAEEEASANYLGYLSPSYDVEIDVVRGATTSTTYLRQLTRAAGGGGAYNVDEILAAQIFDEYYALGDNVNLSAVEVFS